MVPSAVRTPPTDACTATGPDGAVAGIRIVTWYNPAFPVVNTVLTTSADAPPSMTVGAKPGDLVVLWGTGFGATNPPVPAGTAVSGAPAVVTTPRVMVGGLQAEVVSAVLTAGSAGLYQVTIRIPETIPPGPVAVWASVGGAQSDDGKALFIAAR